MTYVPDPIKRLQAVRESQQAIQGHFLFWLKEAIEQGYSNSHIARELGMTESAIRGYRKRNKL